MTWLKLDDGFPEHPKVTTLSDAAFRAHVTGMAYCAKYLTDGFIPEKKAEEIAGNVLDELTSKSRYGDPLWVKAGHEYEIHDYLQYNPTRDKVIAEREAAKQRQASRRESLRTSGVTSPEVNPPRPRPRPGLDLDPKELTPPTPPEEDEESPEQLEAGRFRDVVGIWEQVIGAVPSQKTRETLRAWVTLGYSDAAIESALKTAVKNKANAPAQYATSILRSGNSDDDDDDAEYRKELAAMFANRRIF